MTNINKTFLSAVCASALIAFMSSGANAGGLYVEEGNAVAYPDSVFEFSNEEVAIEVAPSASTTTTVTTTTSELPVISQPVVTETIPVAQPIVTSHSYDVAAANVQYRDNLNHYDASAPILSQEIVTHEYECCDGEFMDQVVTKVIPGERRPVQKVITKMIPQPPIEYHEVITYRVEQPAKEVQEVITEYVETPAREVQEVIRVPAPKKLVQYEEIITHQIKPKGAVEIPVAQPVIQQVVQQPQTYTCTIDASGNPVILNHGMKTISAQ